MRATHPGRLIKIARSPGIADVNQLDFRGTRRTTSVRGYKNILGLEVAMCDPSSMEIVQRSTNLYYHRVKVMLGGIFRSCHKVLSLNVFGGKEIAIRIERLPEVQQVDQVRVVKD